MSVALIPGVEGLKALVHHLLRGDAVVGRNLGRELAAVHYKVPGRHAELIVGVAQHLRRVLEVRIIAQWTEVLAAVVVVVLDDLRFLLGDVARFGSGLLLQPLVRGG